MKIDNDNYLFLQGVLHGISLLCPNRTFTVTDFENSSSDLNANFIAYSEYLDSKNPVETKTLDFYDIEEELREIFIEELHFLDLTEIEYLVYHLMDYIQFTLNFLEDEFLLRDYKVTKLVFQQMDRNYSFKYFLIHDSELNKSLIINCL